MSKTRNNHYVPQWYQEGFFEPGRNTLAYLDLAPPRRVLADGRLIVERALFDAPTSRAFQQRDLYSTFFGTSVNDEIERRLFGDIDARGSQAVRAFVGADAAEQHHHFQNLFEYIDIQKLRTPKGLDWLKSQYPNLNQNELMFEMQGIRMMHCTIWTQGVREIVSAENSDIKFIVSDHPVTIYNHAAPSSALSCEYPNDPTIALKGSQTIFPLNQNFCLILTNLEYAEDPTTNALQKRTFARNYRSSMVRTDSFIRKRKLSNDQVAQINHAIKSRAHRFIAAGQKEWLYPERAFSGTWSDIRQTLLPSKTELFHFGGEMFAQFEDGRVHYQDQFGRTEKQRKFLVKTAPSKSLRGANPCGCGSGRPFKACCQTKSSSTWPTWSEQSIRERNIMLFNGIANVLSLEQGKDWVTVRRNLTDDQISKIYALYEALWPLETDLLQLLPKPDGSARAVYTGMINPDMIVEFALATPLYLGEVIIQHPFTNAGTVKPEFSPVKNPRAYRQQFLRDIIFFMNVMPLVTLGLVNLVPDPCDFDPHLRNQMFQMANTRSAGIRMDWRDDPRIEEMMKQDFRRTLFMRPRDAIRADLHRVLPGSNEADLNEVLQHMELLKEDDPIAVLQEDSLAGGKDGGQFQMMKLAPNFEMALYLAQVTGACIVTDSPFRWRELARATRAPSLQRQEPLDRLSRAVSSAQFAFPQNAVHVAALAADKTVGAYSILMRDVFKYLANLPARSEKPNVEASLAARFDRAHDPAQDVIKKSEVPSRLGKITAAFPFGGIQDNHVNRLLLMSSSELHLPHVPMGFFIERAA